MFSNPPTLRAASPAPGRPAWRDPMLGKVLARHFRLEGLMLQTGMASLYAARVLTTGTKAVVKVAADERRKSECLKREIRFMTLVRHPNVLEALWAGNLEMPAELGGGVRPFLAMEFVGGGTLRDHLAGEPMMYSGRMRPMMRRLQWGEAAFLALQVCLALEDVHALRIVHCDVKPENVMLGRDGHGRPHLKLMDFGLAAGLPLRPFRRVSGTPGYMPPEQFASRFDHRADLFAAGVMLYEMLCGTMPFPGCGLRGAGCFDIDLELMLAGPPMLPSELGIGLPRGAEGVVMRALKRDPARRFQSAAQMREALLSIGGISE